MDSWSATISRREKEKKRSGFLKASIIITAWILVVLVWEIPIYNFIIAPKKHKATIAQVESTIHNWANNIPSFCICNSEDSSWFDPKYPGTLEWLHPWQLHAYGKLYHERDLMGREL